MKVLVTGCCGFVGSRLMQALASRTQPGEPRYELYGVDNLSRAGSELNRSLAARQLAGFYHGDLRLASDFEQLPAVDWVIDASANPSVLAGADGRTSSRQLVEHNLLSTVNILEFCKRSRAGLILLSTSRVYSIQSLRQVELEERRDRFALSATGAPLLGLGPAGVTEEFSTKPPLSLYGSTKIASEVLALEYAEMFDLPVWVNRCGLLAGGGQFGRPDQGIVAFWIHSWFERRPLQYIGFGGQGKQVRDCLHPADLAELLAKQMTCPASTSERVFNVAGGQSHAFSLAQLSAWCEQRFGPRPVTSHPADRALDVPWLVLDSSRVRDVWNWRPQISREEILSEIAEHAVGHPEWMSVT